jgi:hypothetical protein
MAPPTAALVNEPRRARGLTTRTGASFPRLTKRAGFGPK